MTVSGDDPEQAMQDEVSVNGDHSEFDSMTEHSTAQQVEKLVLARKEDRAVRRLRFTVLIVLFFVAIGVCLSVFIFARRSEQDDFESDFQDLANKMVDSFQGVVKDRFGIAQDFAMHVTSLVKNDNNLAWPYVFLTDYAHLMGNTARLADLTSANFVLRVESEDRVEWEDWASEQFPSFKAEYAEQQGIPVEDVKAKISEYIYERLPNGTAIRDPGPGPYMPIFQPYPNVGQYGTMNTNLLTHRNFAGLTKTMMKNRRPTIDVSVDFLALNEKEDPRARSIVNSQVSHSVPYELDPIARVLFPVFRDFDEGSEIVGAFFCGIYWRTYFRDILPPNAVGIDVILENNCGQEYTYRVNGNEARFTGHGDLHDTKYDHLVAGASVDSMIEGQQDDADVGGCLYNIRVYPSSITEDEKTTKKPMIYSLALAGVFVFTTLVFIFYDYNVERRQNTVMKKAQQTGQIVQSLFPEEVRERMFQEQDAKEKQSKDAWKSDDAAAGTEENKQSAIANLYPECTVLFADIAGFTEWSATRSPVQVFELLETIYGAYDKIAKRRSVFKVETIGDCYVAVTGLPNRQKYHAVIMCRFATDCMEKLNDLLNGELIDRLGEDARNLAMRFGMHSGPVTAGVLRGEKSRFQIFGDTVNTAARMESNGIKGRIQVSEATCKLLQDSGKSNWMTPREDLVSAKGKGMLQCYWVQVKQSEDTSSTPKTKSSGSTTSGRPSDEVSDEQLGFVPSPCPAKDWKSSDEYRALAPCLSEIRKWKAESQKHKTPKNETDESEKKLEDLEENLKERLHPSIGRRVVSLGRSGKQITLPAAGVDHRFV